MKLTQESATMSTAMLLAMVSVLVEGQRPARHTATENTIDHSPNQGYMLYLGAWSGCKPSGSLSSDAQRPPPAGGLTFEPQVGVQTRDVKCQDAYESVTGLRKCLPETSPVPSTQRSCLLPESCQMSEWSPWRPEEGVTNPTLIRSRSVISLPQGTGIVCGNTIERKPSGNGTPATPAELFRWAPGAWMPCQLPDEQPPLPLAIAIDLPSQAAGAAGGNAMTGSCGGGTQRRGINCVSRLTGVTVSANFCSSLISPVTVQRCEIPCPRDCVVGEWTQWGPCEPISGCPMSPVEQLTTNGYRKRGRRVIVAASEDGAPCGALAEVQPCSRPACARWVTGAWIACKSLEPRVPCGPGQRTRPVSCVDLQGIEVGEEQCARVGPRPIDSEPCQRACPHDCVVSGWSTWTACSRTCATRHHRPLRTRNRTIIAPPGIGGHACPTSDQLVQAEACNTHSCSGYSWLTLPWQPCTATASFAEVDVTEKADLDTIDNTTLSLDFMQYREVWCVENHDRLVKDSHCAPIKKPETSKICSPPLSQDCQLSEWSAWSDCPEILGEGASQWRSRWVLHEAFGNGSPCGALKESRACPPTMATNTGPRWSHGAWSSCQMPPGVICGDGGLMTRGVWCSLHHHKVPPSICMEELEAELPLSSLRCTVDCNTGCQYSDWSPWSKCESECSGDSTRSRKLLGNAACTNTIVFEGHSCPCDSVNAQLVGAWSSCIILEIEPTQISDTWLAEQDKRRECGAGARYRRLSCQDSSGHRLEPQACRAHTEALEEDTALKGLVRESCWLPCPVDCRMSRWSAWGPCVGAPCGVGLQTRTRNILVNASAGGRPCGFTSQTKVCSRSCEQFAWLAGGWSDCRLIPRHRPRGCGTGDQYRTVRCIEVATSGVVADALCDPLIQPADLNACHLPCPGECVVSEWSEWSQCSERCDPHEQRDRTRALLRGASRAQTAQRCPPLLQAQACLLNRTCFQYSWKTTQWGDCLPLGGSPCGEGLQQKEVFCERSDGRQVPESMCDISTKPVESTEKFCYVDCPIDCEVSEWSPWSFARCKCGALSTDKNYITRTRRVVTPASLTGRKCPEELVQQVLCPLTPCYTLRKSHFPRCKLDGESATTVCGFGVSHRNVSCIRQLDGTEVPLVKCADQLAALKHIPSEVSCFIDCYDDCRHSPWSHWSSCDTEGVRYRKRVSFKPPGPPCPQGPVFKYEVFEYANCNVTESELNKDMYEWNTYDEPTPSQDQDQDDYYIHNEDQPEKTYLLFTGKKIADEHTALAIGIASASLIVMLMVLYVTVRCHKQRTIHKV